MRRSQIQCNTLLRSSSVMGETLEPNGMTRKKSELTGSGMTQVKQQADGCEEKTTS
jgi:hypothetical protein